MKLTCIFPSLGYPFQFCYQGWITLIKFTYLIFGNSLYKIIYSYKNWCKSPMKPCELSIWVQVPLSRGIAFKNLLVRHSARKCDYFLFMTVFTGWSCYDKSSIFSILKILFCLSLTSIVANVRSILF